MNAKDFAAPWSDIKTKAELDHLSSKTRASGPSYTMDGPLGAAVDTMQSEWEEGRKHELRQKLQSMREQVLTAHSNAKVRDRARTDFGRSR